METQDLAGTNVARARTMLDAHKALAQWAERVGLPLPADAEKIRQTIDALLEKVRG